MHPPDHVAVDDDVADDRDPRHVHALAHHMSLEVTHPEPTINPKLMRRAIRRRGVPHQRARQAVGQGLRTSIEARAGETIETMSPGRRTMAWRTVSAGLVIPSLQFDERDGDLPLAVETPTHRG